MDRENLNNNIPVIEFGSKGISNGKWKVQQWLQTEKDDLELLLFIEKKVSQPHLLGIRLECNLKRK